MTKQTQTQMDDLAASAALLIEELSRERLTDWLLALPADQKFWPEGHTCPISAYLAEGLRSEEEQSHSYVYVNVGKETVVVTVQPASGGQSTTVRARLPQHLQAFIKAFDRKAWAEAAYLEGAAPCTSLRASEILDLLAA